MTCREAVYSENVLDYLVSSYGGTVQQQERYGAECVIQLHAYRAVVYKQEDKIDSDTIGQFGYGAIPHVYGLMSEQALEASGVLRIRRQPYLDLLGQNILIGIVDTGIDITHRAFLREDNTTRIAALWDQTIPEGEGPPGLDYGRVFQGVEIDEALQDEDPLSVIPTRDENGHGTYLAGVAAGNNMPGEDFSGVAPLADLVVVKCKQAKNSYREYYRVPQEVPCYQENDIMAGISYILQVAERLQKQVAICIGMGSSQGNHDGESSLAAMIDSLNMFPGVCIVTCVGNEGNAGHHYYITQPEEEIDINVEESTLGFVAELWWQTPGNLQFDVISPGGNTLGITRASPSVRRKKLFVVEDTVVEIVGGEIQEQSRDQVVMFRFVNSKVGVWKIRVYSSEEFPKYHMWLPIKQFLAGETYFVRPDPNTTICEPSNGRRAISVSAYNPVNQAIFIEASRGFTPAGFIKPDVTAPGVDILGPLPRNRFVSRTGTSGAAAMATGIAALFLQQYRSYVISGIAVRELFIRGARSRGIEEPNREFGYGTIDAYASIDFEP